LSDVVLAFRSPEFRVRGRDAMYQGYSIIGAPGDGISGALVFFTLLTLPSLLVMFPPLSESLSILLGLLVSLSLDLPTTELTCIFKGGCGAFLLFIELTGTPRSNKYHTEMH